MMPISILISLSISVFYFFYINLPTDSLLLFLPNKLFLGQWLKKGILPLYNPYIFLGTPFTFDIGLGNFHPLNLVFTLPYPISFSLWIFLTSFIFTLGYLKLFYSLSKNLKFSLLLLFILLFSGHGIFIRTNNPTIWAVISHSGIFFYLLLKLEKNILKTALWGFLITLSGHLQMAFYVLSTGAIISFFVFKKNFKDILKTYFLIFFLSLPYFIFSSPIVLESTRLTLDPQYTKDASYSPLHFIQIFLPFAFGNIKEGARWMVNQTETIISSSLFAIFTLILFIKKKPNRFLIGTLIFVLILTLGIIPLPFLQNYQQGYFIVFSTIIILAAKNKPILLTELYRLKEKRLILIPALTGLSLAALLFAFPPFQILFEKALQLAGKYPHPFFDRPTIKTIGYLFAKSLVPWIGISFVLLFSSKKRLLNLLLTFALLEGVYLNYYHNLFIPQKIISQTIITPPFKSGFNDNYRIQSVFDVYPYQGFHAYFSGVLIRPPFSKEKDFFEKEKRSGYPYFKKILKGLASNWNMIFGLKSVQGYGTFVPKDLSEFFKNPSKDYKQKYANILALNPLLGESEKGLNIDFIASSKITFSDPRWEALAVGYVISPFELKGYDNLKFYKKINGFFVYKTKKPAPIYTLETKDEKINLVPFYQDPNKTIFKLQIPLKQKAKLKVIARSGGKVILANGKKVGKKEGVLQFLATIPKGTKEITIYYSPIEHLVEVIKNFIQPPRLNF